LLEFMPTLSPSAVISIAGVQSWNPGVFAVKILEFLREPSPAVSAGFGAVSGHFLALAHF
jgi:hypothetical protein